ncbi:MAG: citramalate synthase [Victivallales bacterium]|nr:citramalate synthase [Victivallales bacterium]
MNNGNFIKIYDTTLRDGSQAAGVNFSKIDKVRIADILDDFGVSYIEGGWPGSNPKDISFFEAVKRKKFKHAKIAAFGSTRRHSNRVENDDNIVKLLESEAPVITIFGKSWELHSREVLKITPDQNLEIIADSCRYLADKKREVIFDAEHFFDGYKDNPEYALQVLKTAAANGASSIVLCDTNGGIITSEITAICKKVVAMLPQDICVGIHCHNDSGLAVANSLAAVETGITHIQGTVNGFGERCGNADLCSIIPTLELKMGKKCLLEDNLKKLKSLNLAINETANINANPNLPFVGSSAFAHKGGMHVNAVNKNPATFEHIPPETVGNKRRILVSDLSGKTNILMKAAEHNIENLTDSDIKEILSELKKVEDSGYEFESANASFTLFVKKVMKTYEPFFQLEGYRVIVEKRGHNEPPLSEATVKVSVGGKQELTAAEGDGPVNALDKAFRKSLSKFYPQINDFYLIDYKVRIFQGAEGTAAKTRVLIESGNTKESWVTVGVSENIIEASWEALVDSVEYALLLKNSKNNQAK